jgi:probable F420-dependent oxidoreductase
MEYGIFIFATDKAMSVLELAPDVEEHGFDSFWLPEHIHIPVRRETPFPGTPDGSLPDPYFRCQDPFVLLAGVAATTSTLKIGTGICLVSQHDPIDLAKRVASLDQLSKGRFLFGIGAGWLREEMEPMGTPFEKRWQVTAERVTAMKALWTKDKAEFHGEHVQVPLTYSYPKPVQSPHPPIYVGAGSRWARQRVAEWADGWMPNMSRPDRIARGMADIRERAAALGRDPDAISTTVFGAATDDLDAYEQMGVARCIFVLPSAPAREVLPELERVTKAMEARR